MTILDPYEGEAFERLRHELTARFVKICHHLAPDDFHVLMYEMACEQIRGQNARRWH